MNKRLRVGIIIAVVGIGMIALGLFVLSQVVRRYLQPLPVATPPPVITEKVVVVTRDIDIGMLIQPGDVKQLDMPVELRPRNALSEVDQAVGRMAKVPLVAGELVLNHHLADPTNVSRDLAFTIGDNQVLVAFTANDLMSDLGVLQPGDNIDILASLQQEVQVIQPGQQTLTGAGEPETVVTKLFTFDAFQQIHISAVIAEVRTEEGAAPISAQVVRSEGGTPVPTPTPFPAQSKVKAFLLVVSPQDALVLKHLRDAGARFDIVLRSPTSTGLYELNPVYSQYIGDRYQLEVER